MPQPQPHENRIVQPATGVIGPGSAAPRQGRSIPPRLIGFALFSIVLLAAFSRSLIDLAQFGFATKHYSHILLIPFVSAYLIYTKRGKLPGIFSSSLIPAAVGFVFGLLAFAAG